jgi:hypothetical protein
MTAERRKYALREAPQKTSIARQRLARRASAATDTFLETKLYLRNEHTFPQQHISTRTTEELLEMVISIRFVPEL